MRKIVLPALLMSMLSACSDDGSKLFTVSGTLKNNATNVIYAEETIVSTGEKVIRDSANVDKNGKFSMKVKATGEGIYNLRLQNDPSPFLSFINDATNITIEADFKKQFNFYDVKGSDASETIEKYFARVSELQREKFDYYHKADSIKKNNGDSMMAESLRVKQKDLAKEIKTYTEQVLQQSDRSSLTWFIFSTYYGMSHNPYYRLNAFTDAETLTLLNGMATKYPDRTDIITIRNNFEKSMSKWIGRPAPEISMPDPTGKLVSLSSFKGKYVLVDFWASWCVPCRRENPNVVEAYHRFKNKNFTVLGVSLDRPGQKDNWLKAIEDDKLEWTHISDLKHWQSEAVAIYKFQSIPYNVLLDPEGKIIAENLRDVALEQKLDEVLN
jgi:peroxiredoxin